MIQIRPRRLRTTPAMRRLVAQTRLDPAELVLPVFVRDGISEPQPIASMPGIVNSLSFRPSSSPDLDLEFVVPPEHANDVSDCVDRTRSVTS